jgi:hypothetical protein
MSAPRTPCKGRKGLDAMPGRKALGRKPRTQKPGRKCRNQMEEGPGTQKAPVKDRGQTRRRGDLNPRWSCAPHFISSEAHSAALARLQLLFLAHQGYAERSTQCKTARLAVHSTRQLPAAGSTPGALRPGPS